MTMFLTMIMFPLYLCSHDDDATDHDGEQGQRLHAPHEPPGINLTKIFSCRSKGTLTEG